MCSCGTEHYTRWEHFKTRFQCKTCAGTEKPTLEQIRKTAKKLGYELLEFEYRNNRTGIPVKCRSGHYREVSWSSMKIGRRCLGCYLESLPADVDKKIYRSGVINNIIKRLGKDCCFDVREVSIFLIENLPWEVYDIYNNTPGGCHVDHIIPFNFFDCSRNLSQVLSCWNPANLRYLDASTNISRGNRLALEEIRTFNASQRKIFNDALNKPDKYKNLTLPEDRDGWRAWLSRG